MPVSTLMTFSKGNANLHIFAAEQNFFAKKMGGLKTRPFWPF
jgi:hypothetical protein